MKKKKIIIIISTILIVCAIIIAAIIAIRKIRNKPVEDENMTNAYASLIESLYSNEYYAKYKITNNVNDDYITIEVANKGDNIYVKEYSNEIEFLNLVYTNLITFSLDNENKTYSMIEGKTKDVESASSIFSSAQLSEAYTTNLEKGTEAINGVEYNYEKFTDDENITTYYFNNENELKFIKYTYNDGTESIIEVLEYSTTVDDSLFVIPEEYTEVIE